MPTKLILALLLAAASTASQAGNFVYVKPAAMTCAGTGCALSAQLGVGTTAATPPAPPASAPVADTPDAQSPGNAGLAMAQLEAVAYNVYYNAAVNMGGGNVSMSSLTATSFPANPYLWSGFTFGASSMTGSVMASGQPSNAWTLNFVTGTGNMTIYDAETDQTFTSTSGPTSRFQRIVGQSVYGASASVSIDGISPSACASMNRGKVSCSGGIARVSFSSAKLGYTVDLDTGVELTNTFPSTPSGFPN
jgi:hypothetical protein